MCHRGQSEARKAFAEALLNIRFWLNAVTAFPLFDAFSDKQIVEAPLYPHPSDTISKSKKACTFVQPFFCGKVARPK